MIVEPWFQGIQFRQSIKYYGASVLAGDRALITKITKKSVTLVTHDLERLYLVEVNHEDFFNKFVPDFDLTVAAAVRIMCINLLHWLQYDPETKTSLVALDGFKEKFPVIKRKPMKAEVKVYKDHSSRTCLAILKDNEYTFVAMAETGFTVEIVKQAEFERKYTYEMNYPVERAAKLFIGYAVNLGATKEAMQFLNQITLVSPKEIEMATKKKAAVDVKRAVDAEKTAAGKPAARAAAAKKDKEPAMKKAPVKKSSAAAVKAPAKKSAVKKTTDASSSASKKPSAASRFKELILSGKHADDQIFAIVQKEFGLDDGKRSYVKWYRNNLVKDGIKVPAAK